MPGLLPHIDPNGLLEFSVVYTDRALNHMSKKFQGVMTDISAMLKDLYHADAAVFVPGMLNKVSTLVRFLPRGLKLRIVEKSMRMAVQPK